MASRKQKKAKGDATAGGRRTTTPKRRGPGRPKGSKNKTTAGAKTAKRSARPRRYTPADRAKILAAAKREGLSGPAAAKKFGISQLTFYTWRRKAGVKKPRLVRRPRRKSIGGRGVLGGNIAERLRQEIRARVGKLLPSIIASEIASVLGGSAARRGRKSR